MNIKQNNLLIEGLRLLIEKSHLDAERNRYINPRKSDLSEAKVYEIIALIVKLKLNS